MWKSVTSYSVKSYSTLLGCRKHFVPNRFFNITQSVHEMIIKDIKEVLDDKVNPTIKEDGGSCSFQYYDVRTNKVSLTLHGSCVGCPSSSNILSKQIEQIIKHYVPEVDIVAIESHVMDVDLYSKDILSLIKKQKK